MSDIIERLRGRASLDEYANSHYDKLHYPLLREAADEIERLREDLESARAQVTIAKQSNGFQLLADAEIERLRDMCINREEFIAQLLARLRDFVAAESKRWVNCGTGELERIEVSPAGKLAQEAIEALRRPAQGRLTAEDVYAACEATLIGFRDELTERNIKFICDQVARKVTRELLPGEAEADAWVASLPGSACAQTIAPEGRIWVCGACGKTTRDKYGEDRGWDESCMLNAVLCYEHKRFDEKGILRWVPFPQAPTVTRPESNTP